MTFPRGMRPWLVITASLCLVATAGQRPADPVSPQDLKTAIDTLGRLDYDVRMNAARTVRRAGAAMATRALMEAVSGHADGYVRYRALVLLSGFNDPRSRDLMEEAMGDANDRLRAVAYTYFEHNPDKTIVSLLLKALDKEESEFVRPELTRAVAAYGTFDEKARQAILPLVDRGQDFFRGVVQMYRGFLGGLRDAFIEFRNAAFGAGDKRGFFTVLGQGSRPRNSQRPHFYLSRPRLASDSAIAIACRRDFTTGPFPGPGFPLCSAPRLYSLITVRTLLCLGFCRILQSHFRWRNP